MGDLVDFELGKPHGNRGTDNGPVDPPCEGNGNLTIEWTGDAINPQHYRQGDVEAIDVIEHVVKSYPDPVIGGSIWQVLKYVIRAPHKGAMSEDLKKASWYLSRAIGHVGN